MRIFIVLLLAFAFMLGCGSDPKIVEIEKEVPVPVPGGGPGDQAGTSWTQMRALFQKNCAKCHGNDRFGESEQAIRQSNAENLIKTGRMPPNQNGFTDREAMLRFF